MKGSEDLERHFESKSPLLIYVLGAKSLVPYACSRMQLVVHQGTAEKLSEARRQSPPTRLNGGPNSRIGRTTTRRLNLNEAPIGGQR